MPKTNFHCFQTYDITLTSFVAIMVSIVLPIDRACKFLVLYPVSSLYLVVHKNYHMSPPPLGNTRVQYERQSIIWTCCNCVLVCYTLCNYAVTSEIQNLKRFKIYCCYFRKMKGNPIVCNCQLKQMLSDYPKLREKIVDLAEIKCANKNTKVLDGISDLNCGKRLFLHFLAAHHQSPYIYLISALSIR